MSTLAASSSIPNPFTHLPSNTLECMGKSFAYGFIIGSTIYSNLPAGAEFGAFAGVASLINSMALSIFKGFYPDQHHLDTVPFLCKNVFVLLTKVALSQICLGYNIYGSVGLVVTFGLSCLNTRSLNHASITWALPL